MGTTISDREAASQAMCPGNAFTSGTTSVSRRAAAVPHTPLPSGMRTQARLPLERPQNELPAAQQVEPAPVDPLERLAQERDGIRQVGERIGLALEKRLQRRREISIQLGLRSGAVDLAGEHG